MRHNVYVVDDDASVRSSLRFLLTQAGYRTFAFDSGEAFLADMAELEPGCLVLDVRLSGVDGLSVQREMHQRGRLFPTIIITGHGDVPMAVAAMKEGAVDFLSKPLVRKDLLDVLATAMAQLDDADALMDEAEAARVRLNVLTPREYEVMQGLARGLPNKSIAYDLGISPRTVEVHRAHIMQKLEVRSFAEALRIAYAAGLQGRLAKLEEGSAEGPGEGMAPLA